MKGLKCLLMLIFFLFAAKAHSTGDSPNHFIKVNFLYGSKPHPKHENKETKWFGGFHDGHVSIEVDEEVLGFALRVSCIFLPGEIDAASQRIRAAAACMD